MESKHDFFDDFDRLMDMALSQKSYMNVSRGYWIPPTDIYETDSEILIYIEISGMKKEEIDVTYNNGFLFISGERRHVCPASVNAIHRMEINTGKFLRKIKIDMDIVKEDIEAEYRDGILRIVIPKKE